MVRHCVLGVFFIVSSAAFAQRSNLPDQIFLPAGTVIRVYPEQTVTAGTALEGEPLLFTVADDIRLFPGSPVLIPRHSKITASVLNSRKAGRLAGRASLEITFREIITPNWSVQHVNARLISVRHYSVKDNRIIGRGHPKRDIAFLLFPPFTVLQALQIPRRGPELRVDSESEYVIKLMQPLMVETAQVVQKAEAASSLDPSPAAVVAPDPEPPRAALPHRPLTSWSRFGTARPSYTPRRGPNLMPGHRQLLESVGWLKFVEDNIDDLIYHDSELLVSKDGTRASGLATRKSSRRIAEIAVGGRSELEILKTIVHEAAHLYGVREYGRTSGEPFARSVEDRFWRDLQAFGRK